MKKLLSLVIFPMVFVGCNTFHGTTVGTKIVNPVQTAPETKAFCMMVEERYAKTDTAVALTGGNLDEVKPANAEVWAYYQARIAQRQVRCSSLS